MSSTHIVCLVDVQITLKLAKLQLQNKFIFNNVATEVFQCHLYFSYSITFSQVFHAFSGQVLTNPDFLKHLQKKLWHLKNGS